LAVELLDSAEPTEFPIAPRVVAMVVRVSGDELGATDMVDDLNLLYDLNREGERGLPRPAQSQVVQIFAAGGSVLHSRGRTEVVPHLGDQVWFHTPGEIEEDVVSAVVSPESA